MTTCQVVLITFEATTAQIDFYCLNIQLRAVCALQHASSALSMCPARAAMIAPGAMALQNTTQLKNTSCTSVDHHGTISRDVGTQQHEPPCVWDQRPSHLLSLGKEILSPCFRILDAQPGTPRLLRTFDPMPTWHHIEYDQVPLSDWVVPSPKGDIT